MSNARNLANLLGTDTQIQTNDIANNAVTSEKLNDNATQLSGFKNRIINGDMRIDMRRNGSSVTPTLDMTYTLDRWAAFLSVSSKYAVQQNAGGVTPPAGFSNYLGVTSLSAFTAGAAEYFGMGQYIEGFNTSYLAWGTASAASVTVSFWARSSLTGTFNVAFRNSAGNRGYLATYTINAANTWEKKTVTIPGDTTGTWLTNNGIGIRVWFDLGTGSNNQGTAGTWGNSAPLRTAGSVSVVGTSGATFYITGVQLEKGSTATSFDYRPYGTELALCQRYYEVTLFLGRDNVFFYSSTPDRFFSQNFAYAVEKRTTPTSAYVFSSSKFVIPGGVVVDGTGVHTAHQSLNTVKGFSVQVNAFAPVSASSAATYCYEGSFTGAHSAEL